MDQLVLLTEIRDLLKEISVQSHITHTFVVRNINRNHVLNKKLRESELKIIEGDYNE